MLLPNSQFQPDKKGRGRETVTKAHVTKNYRYNTYYKRIPPGEQAYQPERRGVGMWNMVAGKSDLKTTKIKIGAMNTPERKCYD